MSENIKYRGARFYKCALQVNPHNYAEKCQGKKHSLDETSYNQKVAEACRKNNIKIVGLANHGNVDDSESLREFLQQSGVVVFPGFEIASSEKIHMVCLFAENKNKGELNQCLGMLMGKNHSKLKNDPVHPSSLSCEEIARKIQEQQGFWYAAHITGKNGLLRLSGDGDNYVHLWKNETLVTVAQVPGSYKELEEKYRKIIENDNPDYRRKKPISFINAGDVYEPEHLSKPPMSSWIKMTQANFSAFKKAFKDPESRIRLNNDDQDKPVSVIESIRWHGAGLFENQELAFSKNLNAIIGGRGTGKSTMIESIRFVLDLEPLGKDMKEVAMSIRTNTLENAQVVLTVRSNSQHGERYIISRRLGEPPVVKLENGEVSHMTAKDILPEIEILGQNEILEIEKSEKDKLALLEKFLPNTEEFSIRICEAKSKLSDNRKAIITSQNEIDAIGQKVNEEDRLKEKQEQYKRLGIEEKLKNSALLEKESQIQSRVDDQFDRIDQWFNQYEDIFDLNFLYANDISGLPNENTITEIRTIFEKLKNSIDDTVKQVTSEIGKTKSVYQIKLKIWKTETDKIRSQIDQAITQLPEQDGTSGKEIGSQYQGIIVKLETITRHKQELERQREIIENLKSVRRLLLEEYNNTALKRYKYISAEVGKLNKNEFTGKIKISVSRCKNIIDLKEFMRNIEGIGEARISWLDKLEAPIDLCQWSQWIKEGSVDSFKEKYRCYGLVDTVADRLFSISLEERLKLEEIELEDTVSIELNVAHENDPEEYVNIDNLSIGQKCTAILNLLLTNLNDPLIIDQPEDNLDNAFIADHIVRELRNLKTKRQFVFATHNANIPVFGDAELIAVLENRKSKAVFEDIGSIDSSNICNKTAQILEGGRAAFDIRKEKYGF